MDTAICGRLCAQDSLGELLSQYGIVYEFFEIIIVFVKGGHGSCLKSPEFHKIMQICKRTCDLK